MEQAPQHDGGVFVGIPPNLRTAYRIGFWTGVISLALLCYVGGSSDYTFLFLGTTAIGFIVAWISNKLIQGYGTYELFQGHIMAGAM